jgi:MFS family permease
VVEGGVGATSLGHVLGYRRLWLASTTSAFGSYVTTLALQVLVVQTLAGSAADVGLVNAARWLPYLLFGLVVGALVDRVRRRPLLVATDTASAAALVALPVLALTGHLRLSWVIVAVAVFGTATLVGDAAFQSFLPRVVPARLLGPAHARLDQADAVAQGSGPALAGAVVSLVGAPLAVLVDAASYLASAVVMATVGVTEPLPASTQRSVRHGQPSGVARGGFVAVLAAEVAEGLRWVYRHPTLRPLAVSTHAWFACSAIAGAVLAPLALRTLGLSAATLGLALAAAGVGALAGASVAVRLGQRFGAGRLIATTRAGTGLAWAVMATSPLLLPAASDASTTGSGAWAGGAAWAAFAGGQLLLGLCMGAENANEMSYRQTVTPDRLQGRMNATLRSINRAAIVVVAPLGGLLADVVGYRAALYAAAGAVLVVAAATAASPLRTAHLHDDHARAARP